MLDLDNPRGRQFDVVPGNRRCAGFFVYGAAGMSVDLPGIYSQGALSNARGGPP